MLCTFNTGLPAYSDTLATETVFWSKKGSPNTENHRTEWHSLAVTLFCRPSTVTLSGEACNHCSATFLFTCNSRNCYDDTAFVRAIYDYVRSHYCIDVNSVHMSGSVFANCMGSRNKCDELISTPQMLSFANNPICVKWILRVYNL